MRALFVLISLLSFYSLKAEENIYSGTYLFDKCNSAILFDTGVKEDMETFADAMMCFQTYQTFTASIYALESDLLASELYTHGDKYPNFEGYKSAVVSIYEQIKRCDVASISSMDFAYIYVDYIKDNPEYRNKYYTEAIWSWMSAECSINPFAE